jgi:alanine racemase
MLVHRKRVPANYPVGYGSTFRTRTQTDLGVFSVGYADAFLRLHSNRANLWYKGESFPVLGRVSMDQIVVDLKGRDDIRVGSRFTLYAGHQGQDSSLFKEAVNSSTITYERACQLGMMRIPRMYLSSN